MDRLDKAAAHAFSLSRKEAKAVIRGGKVTVDGAVLTDETVKVSEDAVLTFGGQTVGRKANHYYMMHKPAGLLTASRDASRQTVVDLLPPEKRRDIFPVGRLDKDTTGLLLLTDDGGWAHRLVSPRHHVAKRYTVTLDGSVNETVIEAFRQGVTLADGETCKPAELILTEEPTVVTVVLREGKYHQIKRMFGVFGLGVNALSRDRIGHLCLDRTLKPGEWRELTEAEILLAEELK